MIIGNGLVANSLKSIDTADNIFFASGVSNSLETRSSEFHREFTLLKANLTKHSEHKFIYFSTLSINDQSKQDSHYVLHKLAMEEYIKNHAKQYLILRIGNIVGKGGNPNTLFNYLKNQITHNHTFTVHSQARRLLIDMDDITEFLSGSCCGIKNSIVNCAFPYYYDLKEIINAIEEKTQKKAIYKEVNEGDFYKVAFEDDIKNFFESLTPKEYITALAEKYI
jgi:nucleoside-diphosphate-sugar epimerase